LDLEDLSLTFGDLRDDAAWRGFMKGLSEAEELADEGVIEIRERAKPKRWYRATLAAGAILIIVAAVVAIWNLWFRPVPPAAELALPDKPSIAVLPFVNVSGDPEKEYFSDGITEELINTFARLKGLRVISRTSSFVCKEKDLDIKTIGEKLKVDAVLEGSVRTEGNKLRIAAQLVKVADDSHLWAATYDREMKDIFAIQEEISRAIVDKLEVKLLGKEAIIRRSTENPEAYILYIKGRFFWNQSTRAGNEKALEYYEKALTVDPNFSLAYAGLSDVYQQLMFSRSLPRTEIYTKAKFMAMKALEIDENLPEAHASLGLLKYRYEWDWEGAEKALKQAIKLNPSCSVAHRYYSEYFRTLGRLDEAIKEAKRALELDPLSDHINRNLGITFRCSFQVDEAIEQFRKALEMQPNNTNTLALLGNTYVQKGMYDEGIVALQKVLDISPNNPFALGFLGSAYALAGKKDKSQKILEKLLERSKRKYFSPYFIAMIYTRLGEKDKAFEWLEKACVERDPLMFPIKTVPDFESLRSDPRWMALLKRMGLEE
jgi:TolB-like protein/Tfp pilus assembly protein PilF